MLAQGSTSNIQLSYVSRLVQARTLVNALPNSAHIPPSKSAPYKYFSELTSFSGRTQPPHSFAQRRSVMATNSLLKKWDGAGKSQEDFMQLDDCIVVDENDNITGYDNKYNCHRFEPHQPTGILHRAFSVFLFNSKGELLLQQRAPSKITFPSVWTNTCCSHPLYGYEPTEVDTPEDVAAGTTMGVKYAAVRKLDQELGIAADQVPVDKFKFLTRLHYCAPDALTYGDNAEWGEHEVDYILFIQTDVDVTPHPDEVCDFKFVNQDELKRMMDPSTGLKWSPWFRIIAEKFLTKWWADLEDTLTTDKHVDLHTIHRVL